MRDRRSDERAGSPRELSRRQVLAGGLVVAGGLVLGLGACSARGGRIGWNEPADWASAERVFARGPFTSAELRPLLDAGRRPIVSYKASAPWAAVASGELDGELDAIRTALDEIDGAADVTYHHEPENDEIGHSSGNPPFGTAEEYVAASRRFFDRAVDGTGAVYALCLTGSGYEDEPERWDPGIEGYYASDPYNRWGADGDTWLSLDQLTGAMVAYAERKGSSSAVWETNAMEDPADPERKARWIRDAAATAAEREFETLLFFDGGEFDWTLLSSPEADAAVLAAARTEYFTA